ncbi:MAG: 4-hydroxy-tetrahydrodipicolinate synthase [Lachnospiraceae bacterium]|nr:4-hydroxy-tetrahydrodipicolinate synthase [Lachnospiraceae bacterium]
MSIFKGAGVAIVTPFKENGDINYEKFAEIIEQQVQNGTDCIVVCGTTGEAACLTEEEHLAAIKFCVEQVNHRIPVMAGAGSNSTKTAIYLSEEAEKVGADALLSVTPYYNKTTQQGLIEHFTDIAGAVDIPIVLYSVKSRTGVNIEPETVKALVDNVPNIVGIKEASGSMPQAEKIKAICPDVELYSGDDEMTVPMMSVGGIGVISVVSNIAPRFVHDMCMKALNGDFAGAAAMQLSELDLVDALFCETNPIPVKEAMNMMGMEVGPLRKPLVPMAEKNREKLRKAMTEFGLLK